MINEIWRALQDNEDAIFAVSNHGRVQNMMSGEVMELFLDDWDPHGRLWVSLNSGMYSVDELVAHTFICCLDCDMWEVIHKDGDVHNNMLWNIDLVIDQRAYDYWRCKGDDCE